VVDLLVVEKEAGIEQADPIEDPNDQPTPKGAAYEVEISKDGQALKVFLDSSLKPIETQRDAG